ncbi:MAG: L-2-amino-thiazoline-4-carboxylic acid hydrolase [Lachnospiraceae bacterium]|jgi:hypothetical protein|nr:L-2-amino-thiazoline-4-carboxylic acid hydrolase [Lachnospiraceae bacterium]
MQDNGQFAALYLAFARTLTETNGIKGKAAIREAVRGYGKRLGQLKREQMLQSGYKPNLRFIMDKNWGVPCGRGAVREWLCREEEELFVNILSCPMAAVWETEPLLGQMYCEEFYPAYVKAAVSEKAQINLGKTLLNEGDEFCRLSVYLRPANLCEKERRELFPKFDAAFCNDDKKPLPELTEEVRCRLFLEAARAACEATGTDAAFLHGYDNYEGEQKSGRYCL